MEKSKDQTMERTVPIEKYIAEIEGPYREKFLEQMRNYKLNKAIVEKLKLHAKNFWILAFSAKWCKDCARNIPILALIAKQTKFEVRIFGGLMKDPLNPTQKWRIPPSPPEVETFHVNKIPLIMVLDKRGREIGRIVENPRRGFSLEEEILNIISKA